MKVGPFKDPKTGKINPDPANTVEALKKQYESAFSTPKEDKIVEDPTSFFNTSDADHPHLADFIFTSEDIEEACKELSADSAVADLSCCWLPHRQQDIITPFCKGKTSKSPVI